MIWIYMVLLTFALVAVALGAISSAFDLYNLRREVKQMGLDFTAVRGVVSQLSTDFSTFKNDVTTKLAALQANQSNPADAQALADVVTALEGMDQTIKDADAALNPPAATGSTSGTAGSDAPSGGSPTA